MLGGWALEPRSQHTLSRACAVAQWNLLSPDPRLVGCFRWLETLRSKLGYEFALQEEAEEIVIRLRESVVLA